jgi:hypothetical protein
MTDKEGFTRVRIQRKLYSRRPFYPSKKSMTSYSSYFYGYFYSCNQFGHRAKEYRIIPRRSTKFMSQNPFVPLTDMNVICYNYNNFGHIERNCRMKFVRPNVKLEKGNSQPPKPSKEIEKNERIKEMIEKKPKII